jgi:hypothetical protein
MLSIQYASFPRRAREKTFGLYPPLVKDARRANTKRFLYGIWFKVEEELNVSTRRKSAAIRKGRLGCLPCRHLPVCTLQKPGFDK